MVYFLQKILRGRVSSRILWHIGGYKIVLSTSGGPLLLLTQRNKLGGRRHYVTTHHFL